jgi:hypothetical protein
MDQYSSKSSIRANTLVERLRSNDPTETSVIPEIQNGQEWADEIINALQNNTVVDSIHCNLFRTDIQNFDPLFTCIRARRQLGELKIQNVPWELNIGGFLEAASENTGLHTLDIIGSYIYTPRIIGKTLLASHSSKNMCYCARCTSRVWQRRTGHGPMKQ